MKLIASGFLFCLCCYMASAWIPRLHANSFWPLSRASSRCVPSGGQCLTTSQCCEMSEVCALGYDSFNKGNTMIGSCKKLARPAIDQYPLGESGDECTDSSECGPGLCCRKAFRHHSVPSLRCGEPEGPVICIERSRANNEIYRK
ncbi:Hypothetical predicted protein [Octopus vulgaris]|uniref:Uncharacterized protein n=2 Tax=Octopus TaxID=6643 RepID=A0AA36ASA3_OCTVU|nr:uncharacterized protein LOC115210635 [Octopus sinensis]CAI9720809.1 Hypothetical predicted protein [Octopus vulgaris]